MCLEYSLPQRAYTFSSGININCLEKHVFLHMLSRVAWENILAGEVKGSPICPFLSNEFHIFRTHLPKNSGDTVGDTLGPFDFCGSYVNLASVAMLHSWDRISVSPMSCCKCMFFPNHLFLCIVFSLVLCAVIRTCAEFTKLLVIVAA